MSSAQAWVQVAHCAWDCGRMRIVQQYCPTQGGVRFKLFNGAAVTWHLSLQAAQTYAAEQGVPA